MELMIAVPLVIPDEPLPLADLEARVEAWGHALMRQALAEAWVAQAPWRSTPLCPACAPAARTTTEPLPPPAHLAVELDGAWVAARDSPHGLAVKVGVIHAGSEVVGRTRCRLRHRRYTATTRGVVAFEQLVTAAIEHRNGFATPVQTLLGDGANWIWRLGDDTLPESTKILDRWQLRQARRRAPWSERLEALLEVGDVPGALMALLAVAAAAPHPALDEFAGYLTALAPRIPDYAARWAAGESIGSGGIEKGGDLVVNRRLKGRRGMRWWRERIEGVGALRVALLNDEWDAQVTTTLAA